MRAILREVAKCRELLAKILVALTAYAGRLDSIDSRLGVIESRLDELAEGPDQSSVDIVIGPITEQ